MNAADKSLVTTLTTAPSGEYRLIWDTYRSVLWRDWPGGEVQRKAFEQVLTRLIDAGAYVDGALWLLDRQFPDAMLRLESDPDSGDGYTCTIVLHLIPSVRGKGATRALSILAALVNAKDAAT